MKFIDLMSVTEMYTQIKVEDKSGVQFEGDVADLTVGQVSALQNEEILMICVKDSVMEIMLED